MNNEENNLTKGVFEKISHDAVQPKARWYFSMRHAALWFPGIAITIVGAIAIAGILFSAVHGGWQYRSFTHSSMIGFLVQMIPLLWIAGLVLFCSLIVKSLRLTTRGYRYTTGVIVGGSFIVSVVLGAAVFALDQTVTRNGVIRFGVERVQKMLWLSPEEGRIAGDILIEEDGDVFLTDARGRVWPLDVTELHAQTPMVHGASLRLVGAQKGGVFIACLAFPWEFGPEDRPENDRARQTMPMLRHPEGSRCAEILTSQMDSVRERNLRPRP